MRDPDELLKSALAVLDRAFALSPRVRYFGKMFPLYSGGYDSVCACYVASRHPKFGGAVYHIDTGIGSKATRRHVDETCDELGWKLVVLKSKDTFEKFVTMMGFPGPGGHQWVYLRLKDRCIEQIERLHRGHVVLVTGCRSSESQRRMGHVTPLRVGDPTPDGGTTRVRRVWVNPCHDWTDEEQRAFVAHHGFPRNPVKDSILGMSGECLCGAFARPNEREMIRQVCPDVDAEIVRLEALVEADGVIEERNRKWGYRGKDSGRKPIEVADTGPLCSNCDRKAAAAGIVIKPCG